MVKITAAGIEHELESFFGTTGIEKLISQNPRLFGKLKRTIYFWDCETKQGLPSQKPRNLAFRPSVMFAMFDQNTGKIDEDMTKQNLQVYQQVTGRVGERAVKKAYMDALPMVKMPFPYDDLIVPVKDHMVRVVAEIEWMVFFAYPTNQFVLSTVLVQIPAKVTLTAHLLMRCGHEQVKAPESWKPKVAGAMPQEPDLLKKLYEEDRQGKKERKRGLEGD